MKLQMLILIGSLLGANASAGDKINGVIVFLDNGREILFRVEQGKELWRFKAGRGEFFRSSFAGTSKVIADQEQVMVSSTTSVFAVDLKTGKQKWSFDFSGPASLVRLSHLFISGDVALLSTNQIGYPLICLDKATGKKIWSYPLKGPEQLGFHELAAHDGKVLIRVAVTYDSRKGYKYENRALDLATGTPARWPAEVKMVPKRDPLGGGRNVDVAFAGETQAPVQKDDRFIGVLKRTDNGVYYLYRPRFFATGPHYHFRVSNDDEFARLVELKVEIRGKILSIAQSAPPQYLIQALAIKPTM